MKDLREFYKNGYTWILRLYPGPFRERFAESMLQTFSDLLHERTQAGKGLFLYALWVFVETSFGACRENATYMKLDNKLIVRIAIGTGAMLALPLIAMQFTDEVAWQVGDFIVAGILLFGSGLSVSLLAGRFPSIAYRMAVGLTVGAALFLVWANLAVGIIGNEENPANLIFGSVLVVGLVGGLVSRFQPRGMVRVMIAMAVVQLLISMITPILGWGPTFVVNGFFAALWIVSALLFHNADRQRFEPDRAT